MKDYLNFVIAGIIAGLLILNLRTCDPEPEIITKIDTVINTVYRDFLKIDTVIQNKYITKNVHDTIKVIVNDTIYIASEIISDWFAIKFIPDTVYNSDSLFLVVSDSLYQNNIKSRRIDYKAIKTTHNYLDDKHHFYIGIGTAINENISLSGNLFYQRKKSLFGIGYNSDKQIVINYAYKIK